MIRLAAAALSVLTIVVTGVSWWAMDHAIGGITVSQALGASAPRSSGGAMNILLIGLDSRRDQDGNVLPQEILDKLHAGDSDSGGYNTNTLILAHIDSDDRVTAFSIPRDDYVAVDDIPGYDHIKIKEAYGLTKADTEQKLVDNGITDQQQLESRGREAGRAATLTAVRNLTGAPIDYFAEVNLAGFYDLTATLGGIQVCLNNPVQDSYSGADFPAGLQTLDAAEALAFVRQRHGLDNGDLDRTHRQQAFLVSAMHQLQDAGTFTDLTKLDGLMAVARRDVVLSTGWGPTQFRRIGAINGSDVQYRTLPVLRYDNVDDQDVNIVDPVAIKTAVAKAFSTQGPDINDAPTPTSTVDVVNGGGTEGLATTISEQLSGRGYTAGQVRTAAAGESTDTAIDYGTGAATDAQNLAALLGIAVAPRQDPAQDNGRIRVTLGPEYTLPPNLAADPSSSESSGDVVPPPDRGVPLGGNGIPCVD